MKWSSYCAGSFIIIRSCMNCLCCDIVSLIFVFFLSYFSFPPFKAFSSQILHPIDHNCSNIKSRYPLLDVITPPPFSHTSVPHHLKRFLIYSSRSSLVEFSRSGIIGYPLTLPAIYSAFISRSSFSPSI